MIVIPGKVISANPVLNRLNPGTKFIHRRMTNFVRENEKFSARGSRYRQNLVWQTSIRAVRAAQLLIRRSTNHSNDLWSCPSRCLCHLPFLNCQLLATGELRDCLHLKNRSMPSLGSLLLDQPLLKLLFPKQEYIPSNSLRPGTWRVVVTLKIPLSCNVSISV